MHDRKGTLWTRSPLSRLSASLATPRTASETGTGSGRDTQYPASKRSIASLLPGWPDPAMDRHMARISCKGFILSTFFFAFAALSKFSSRPFWKLMPMSKPVFLWFSFLIRGRESGPVFGPGRSFQRPFNPFVVFPDRFRKDAQKRIKLQLSASLCLGLTRRTGIRCEIFSQVFCTKILEGILRNNRYN